MSHHNPVVDPPLPPPSLPLTSFTYFRDFAITGCILSAEKWNMERYTLYRPIEICETDFGVILV